MSNKRSRLGATTTATIRSRCSPRSVGWERCTRSRSRTGTTRGSWFGMHEARAALNDPRLSKDMQAALASGGEVVAEGLPGPAFARHMLVVDPPDHTRLRRLVAAAFSVRRIESLRTHVQSIVDDLLDAVAARGPDGPVDLVAAFAFPLPFTVICEMLGVSEPERATLGRQLTALLGPTSTPEEYARAKEASDAVVAMLSMLVEAKQASAGRRSRQRADHAPATATSGSISKSCSRRSSS